METSRKRNREEMDLGSSDNDDDLVSPSEESDCEEYQCVDLGYRDRKKIGSHRAAMNHFGKFLSKVYPDENWRSAVDIPRDSWEKTMIGKFPSYLFKEGVKSEPTINKYLSELRSFVSTNVGELEDELFPKKYYTDVRRQIKRMCAEEVVVQANIRATYEDLKKCADLMFKENTNDCNALRALQNINLQLLGRIEDANRLMWQSLCFVESIEDNKRYLTMSFLR
jgi:hypothetical protein